MKTHSRCSCRGTAPQSMIRGAEDLLPILGDSLLMGLAQQCDLKAPEKLSRREVVSGVLSWRRANPGSSLYLKQGRPRKEIHVKKNHAMFLGGYGPPLVFQEHHEEHWPHPEDDLVLGIPEIVPEDLVIILDPPMSVSMPLPSGCGGPLTVAAATTGITVDTDGVLLTDMESLQIAGTLELREGSAVIGAHACGLRLICESLGVNLRALITTSVVPSAAASILQNQDQIADNLFEINPADGQPEFEFEFELDWEDYDGFTLPLPASLLEVDRLSDMNATDPSKPDSTVEGEQGEYGGFSCSSDGGDGSTPQTPDGADNGVDGQDGRSTGYLAVVAGDRQGTGVLFLVTSAGRAGHGTGGQDGTSTRGGKGGAIQALCSSFVRPGNGGAGGQGGAAGNGGAGGNGGDAGSIFLSAPQGGQWWFVAFARGGEAGCGGQGGKGGRASGGKRGGLLPMVAPVVKDGEYWPEPWPEWSEEAIDGQDGDPGDDGTPGDNGNRGSNGRIATSEEILVTPNFSRDTTGWSYREDVDGPLNTDEARLVPPCPPVEDPEAD